MKLELAKFIKEIADNTDISCNICENYSGRGMYGNTTTGIVVNNLGDFPLLLLNTILYADESLLEKVNNLMESGENLIPNSFRNDNLGHDIIIY